MENIVSKQKSLTLPDDIKVIEYIGEGRRAFVYKAKLSDADVIVKVYKKNSSEKYLKKYNFDIAQYEFDRNTSLYNIPQIQEYIAKPFRVYTADSIYTHSIIQEFVPGTILEDLIIELGNLPQEILEAGYHIVKHAEKNNIHDLDISAGNLKINNHAGIWKPKLYDFNLIPQYLYPPNLILGLAIKTGIRKKSYRDYRSLKNWKRRGEQRLWKGRN